MPKLKVKMLTSIAGPGIRNKRGDIVEMEEKEAKRHVAAGNVEYVNRTDANPLEAVEVKIEISGKKKRIGKKPVHTR